MASSVRHNHKDNRPIRWGFVAGTIAAVFAAALLACAVWYIIAVMIPNEDNVELGQVMADREIDLLTQQVLKIDAALHLPFGRYGIPSSSSSSL